MADSERLVELVRLRLKEFLDARTDILSPLGVDAHTLSDISRDFLSGGKRFRASFCYWGWRAVQTSSLREAPTPLTGVVAVAAALEVFHAAALVHDDIIDSSDTRRGRPAGHRRFEALHREGGWSGDAAHFGVSAAILLGDLLLGWSDELLDEGLAEAGDRVRADVRREFARMRTQVTAGQYLDVLEENAWPIRSDDDALERAHRVIVYKSAKYSVEAPLVIGALLASPGRAQLDALHGYGLPLGIAYQLRDDLLGVFGDPEVTGKPSGDDLREGKRTVLVAHTRRALTGGARRLFDELLGDPGLDGEQIRMLQRAIRDCGADKEVERTIAGRLEKARSALDEAPLAADAVDRLRALATAVAHRER